jgi:hypothetical protein
MEAVQRYRWQKERGFDSAADVEDSSALNTRHFTRRQSQKDQSTLLRRPVSDLRFEHLNDAGFVVSRPRFKHLNLNCGAGMSEAKGAATGVVVVVSATQAVVACVSMVVVFVASLYLLPASIRQRPRYPIQSIHLHHRYTKGACDLAPVLQGAGDHMRLICLHLGQ